MDLVTKTPAPLLLLALALALGACAGESDTATLTEPVDAEADVSAVALAIEEAGRSLDRGLNVGVAKKRLIEALAADTTTPAEHASATLALSRAHEALGEREQAITVIEKELAVHAQDYTWNSRTFQRRLRQLLTGHEENPGLKLYRDEPISPFAHVVASYFPQDAHGQLSYAIAIIGGDRRDYDELGLFNAGEAARVAARKVCPLCDLDISVNRSMYRGNWGVFAGYQGVSKVFVEALKCVYFDLGRDRIPARYESYLPMKVADIERQLEAGKSFIIAKEKIGGAPTILLAAPRSAMLEEVTKKLASLDALPTTAVYVDVPTHLRQTEIRGVMRAYKPDARLCYGQLRARSPQAEGKLVLRVVVQADGSPSSVTVDHSEPSFDEAFTACLTGALQKRMFPATGNGVTQISYPLVLNQGQ